MDDSRLETDFAPDGPPPDGWCCWPLWNRLNAAGERGLSVATEHGTDGPRFWLQSRGVDVEDERRIRMGEEAPRDLHINIAASIRIRYCPWCGSRLDEVAASAADSFARLAVAHRELAPPTV